MKVIVVSDDHGRKDLIDEVYRRNNDADLYLHAGDSLNMQENLYPFLTVKGNNDYYISNLFRIEKIGNYNIYLTHGHKCLLSNNVLRNIAKNNDCQILIHGHIHRPYYEVYGGIHIICPGSLNYPRSKEGATYAILNIVDNKVSVELKKL